MEAYEEEEEEEEKDWDEDEEEEEEEKVQGWHEVKLLSFFLKRLEQIFMSGSRETAPTNDEEAQKQQSGAACHRAASPPVWHFCGPSADSEYAKTTLCNSWRHGFARSRRDLTICVAKGGASSSGFLFRKAASDLRRPGSAC